MGVVADENAGSTGSCPNQTNRMRKSQLSGDIPKLETVQSTSFPVVIHYKFCARCESEEKRKNEHKSLNSCPAAVGGSVCLVSMPGGHAVTPGPKRSGGKFARHTRTDSYELDFFTDRHMPL